MPLYDLQCESCDHEWEDLLSTWRSPLPDCPECGKSKVKKLMSAPRGIVELTGHDLSQSIKAQGAKLAAEAATNENVAANLCKGGEEAYHAKELAHDSLAKDLNIK